MSPAKRWAVLAVVIVAAVVAFVIVQPGGTSKKSKPTSPSAPTAAPPTAAPTPPPVTTVTVVRGKPAGGVTVINAKKGRRVRFIVRSDVADEIHVHGYDLMKDVAAGGSVNFDFPAKIDGGFDVELEKHGEQIATLKVQP